MDELRKEKIEFAKKLMFNSYELVDKNYVDSQVIGVDLDHLWKLEQRRLKIKKIKDNYRDFRKSNLDIESKYIDCNL